MTFENLYLLHVLHLQSQLPLGHIVLLCWFICKFIRSSFSSWSSRPVQSMFSFKHRFWCSYWIIYTYVYSVHRPHAAAAALDTRRPLYFIHISIFPPRIIPCSCNCYWNARSRLIDCLIYSCIISYIFWVAHSQPVFSVKTLIYSVYAYANMPCIHRNNIYIHICMYAMFIYTVSYVSVYTRQWESYVDQGPDLKTIQFLTSRFFEHSGVKSFVPLSFGVFVPTKQKLGKLIV